MDENKSNQWELDGDCSLCRRRKYCSKPCTRCKRETQALIRGFVANALDERTGGAYSMIMENSRYL